MRSSQNYRDIYIERLATLSRVRHSTGRRRKKHEEHANHEAWAIPYADLLTLLLAFFVVMYAISSVNAGKYRVLSDSLFAAFRGAPRSMQPVQVGDKQVGTGADMNSTVVQQSVLEGKAQSRMAPVPVALGMQKPTGDASSANKLPPQAAAAAQALSRLADQIAQAMNQLVRKDMVTIRRSDFWIEVEMKTDILFPSGSARLADNAVDVIEQLGSVLAPFPNPIRVEGHTDNKPIKTAVFYSNWELSAARAGSVVRVLSNHGVGPERLAVIGYGEQRPLKGNDTADGRNANRRVVVVILSTELMRQTDPATVTDSDTTAPAVTAPPAGPTHINAIDGGGAIASPADSPQAQPAPVTPQPVIPPASAQTARADIQHNTGTEPAP
ncbi:MAG TPA: flagellar motor protein MotD [Steroidobacteraceae bacterium]|nr:flagellar motor protein MotD [Steroidobacteraceae bacterium]